MTKNLITIAIAAVLSLNISAKEPKVEIPVDQWMLSHATSADAEIDGVKMHYPTMTDGMAIISAQLPVKITYGQQILTNALVANGDNEEITIAEVQPEQNSFTYKVKQQRGSYKDATTLTYSITAFCQKGQMELTAHSISINYKEKGIIPRTLKIEKMNPANNQRHAELIDLLALEASRLMADMATKAEAQKSRK